MRKLRMIVGCEYSGTVRDAFARRGWDAWSCDLLQTESPGNHFQCNVLDVLGEGWDLGIFHPPCTYFSRAGLHWMREKPERKGQLEESFELVKRLWAAPIEKICIENPVGWLNTNWMRATQIIHPWYYGDGEMKETCFWLKNLSRLNGKAEIAISPEIYKPVPDRTTIRRNGKIKNHYFMSRVHNAKDRAKTFQGVAEAMAAQWGSL